MTTKRFKTDINCGNCVAAVTPVLDKEPAIHSWRVDTANPDKVLTVEGDNLTADIVAQLVSRTGFHVLGEIDEPGSTALPSADKPATYYPLALLLIYLAGACLLFELGSGTFLVERAMRHFMALFFFAFSFFQLLDRGAFAMSFASYDVIARRWPPYGYLYPFLEVGLGAAYLANFEPLATNVATLVLMMVSSVGVAQNMLAGRTVRCACLGTVLSVPVGAVTLVENLGMAVMAAAMLALPA